MKQILIFGNSGSGKSTLAKELATSQNLGHLDLDTIAWQPTSPPQRIPIASSKQVIDEFTQAHPAWIIEGCYSDLLELVIQDASEIIFMNLPINSCINNAKNRPWEPHKYPSKAAQDANLDMLIEWIKQYETRTDTFSRIVHQRLFDNYQGKKTQHTSNIATI